MKLIELFEADMRQPDIRLGRVNGYMFFMRPDAGPLKNGLTIRNLEIACKDFGDKLSKISAHGIEIRSFYMHLKQYNTLLFCAHNVGKQTIHINRVQDPADLATNHALSVMEMNYLYEVFDNTDTYYGESGFRAWENINRHGMDQVGDRNLKNAVSREQIEQALDEAAEKVKYLDMMDFKVKYAQIYSKSAQQGLIVHVSHEKRALIIKTYLPHGKNEIKPNCVMLYTS